MPPSAAAAAAAAAAACGKGSSRGGGEATEEDLGMSDDVHHLYIQIKKEDFTQQTSEISSSNSGNLICRHSRPHRCSPRRFGNAHHNDMMALQAHRKEGTEKLRAGRTMTEGQTPGRGGCGHRHLFDSLVAVLVGGARAPRPSRVVRLVHSGGRHFVDDTGSL
ncbi:hypothetical protein BHM03_00059581 [Ensete ventricosum]|nr:hypothetical protein BHM03_00059581 [Ensete ventricosum]